MQLQFVSLVKYIRTEFPDSRSWWVQMIDWFMKVEQIKTYRYEVTIRFDQLVSVGSAVHARFVMKDALKPIYAEDIFKVVDRQHLAVKMVTVAATPDWLTYEHFKYGRYIVTNVPFGEAAPSARG